MKVVCATDLSAASEVTIESETCLECLGRIGIEEIRLVTVIPSNVHAGMPGMDFEGRRKEALGRYRRVVENAGFEVETHVVRGTPHRRIRGVAETIGASLTIVGSRGESPLENRVVGSTARNLARTTETPLLVNRINAEPTTLVHVETPKDPASRTEKSPKRGSRNWRPGSRSGTSRREPRFGGAIPPTRSSRLRPSTIQRRSSSAREVTAGSVGCCSAASPKRSSRRRTGTCCSSRRRVRRESRYRVDRNRCGRERLSAGLRSRGSRP